jgi:hypothetical protein
VFLDEILDTLLLEELEVIALHVENDLGTSGKSLTLGILSHGESTSSGGLPSPLMLIIIRLRDNGNPIGNKISRIETDTKLSNHGDISTARKSLHKGLSTGLGDSTKIVDQLLLGHTDTGIPESKGIVGLIGNNPDSEVGLNVQLSTLRVGNGLVPDLIEGIGSIRNQLSKENLLVRIEGVDDQTHQLLDISLKSKVLSHFYGWCWCCWKCGGV